MRKVVFETAPELKILYQDEHLVAVNKPSGLLVHRSEIDKRETLFALQLTRDLVGQRVYPVHRLDRPTSGVLLFALNQSSAKHLSEQFRNHSITKQYLAVVRGWTEKSVEIDYPLKVILDKKSDKNRANNKEAQGAQTFLETLQHIELDYPSGRYEKSRYSLVKLSPKTGRKHQLRRHMAHIRHPIIGDTNHGDGKQNSAARQYLQLDRMVLHANSLEFRHPETNMMFRVQAEVTDDLAPILKYFDTSFYEITV